MRTDYSPPQTTGGRWLFIARNSVAVLVAKIGSHHGRGPWANACGWACSVIRRKSIREFTMQAIETLELRLTDAQIAAIRQRIARRKRQIKECDGLELGEINGMEDLQSYLAQIDERTHTQRLSSSREFSLQTL